MEHLENYKNRIKAIEELANKMESGTLTIAELSHLETLTRELHERSIILKYKAFENKVISTNSITESGSSITAEMKENVSAIESVQIEESEPTIDFSIFDTPVQEKIVDEIPSEEPAFSFVETIEIKEPIQEIIEEVIVEHIQEEKVVDPANNVSQAQATSFWEQLNIRDNSLSTQFEGAKIDTLIGAFGLNEKLRFINDLFDGSSESFSEAIKILDNQANIEEAKVKSAELANQHNWDAEEESVVDFMTMVNRRYA